MKGSMHRANPEPEVLECLVAIARYYMNKGNSGAVDSILDNKCLPYIGRYQGLEYHCIDYEKRIPMKCTLEQYQSLIQTSYQEAFDQGMFNPDIEKVGKN